MAFKLACFDCEAHLDSRTSLRQHLRTSGHSRAWVCGQCDRKLASELSYNKHRTKHEPLERRYCLICRTTLSSALRLEKHKAKLHKDFANELIQAERRRWEKEERRRQLLQQQRKGARKSHRRFNGNPGEEQDKNGREMWECQTERPSYLIMSRHVKRTNSNYCIGCNIKFSTRELFTSHISKYEELGLQHRPFFADLPMRSVVLKKLLLLLREERGSEWNVKVVTSRRPIHYTSPAALPPLCRLTRTNKIARRKEKGQWRRTDEKKWFRVEHGRGFEEDRKEQKKRVIERRAMRSLKRSTNAGKNWD